METAIVIGASSQLGVFLLPRLQLAGIRVIALSRQAPPKPVALSRQVHWARAVDQSMPTIHLVSCGPLGLAHSLVLESPNLERLVAFSTSSVLTKAGSRNRQERELVARIKGEEQELRSLCSERGIALALFRPTLIYGCGLDRNVSTLARLGRRFGFIPVATQAGGLRQPVHADDLAELAVHCLLREAPVRLESVVCGGSILSYREMVAKTAAACGDGVRTLTLNTRAMAILAGLASRLPGLGGINPEMVKRQSTDLVFDDSKLRETLGYNPRPFDPRSEDFEIPEFAGKLQLRR